MDVSTVDVMESRLSDDAVRRLLCRSADVMVWGTWSPPTSPTSEQSLCRRHVRRLLDYTETSWVRLYTTVSFLSPQPCAWWCCPPVCLFDSLSSLKFINLFARWKHLAASGGLSYWVRYTCFQRRTGPVVNGEISGCAPAILCKFGLSSD